MTQANNCLRDGETYVIHRAGKEQKLRPEPVVHKGSFDAFWSLFPKRTTFVMTYQVMAR